MPEPRIQILPPEVAERIAAGEVVERPSSVVKELVENALDAGARRITVETRHGGKTLIRVTDDGSGMTPEEARLSLQRHATSKLRSAEDLFNILTLGFRGEAIPSIAAVSELEIRTRPPEAAEGTRLLVEGGRIRAEEPVATPVGTAITVQRLFFNLPVREKFLRSDPVESGQITEWLQRLALSRPDVSFRLTHDGREALLSPGSQDPLNAVVAVLGRAVAREMLRVGGPPPGRSEAAGGASGPAEGRGAVEVAGFVGRPTLTRANRGLQHFYVNGRSVRSPLFYKALDDAFRSSMPAGRHPAALLFLQVPPESVDVNVHPAKTEVRFQDESAVVAAVTRAVQGALRAGGGPGDTPLLIEPPQPPPRIREPGAPPLAPAPEPGTTPFADAALNAPPAREERRDWSWSRPAPERAGPGAEPPARNRDPEAWRAEHGRSGLTSEHVHPEPEPPAAGGEGFDAARPAARPEGVGPGNEAAWFRDAPPAREAEAGEHGTTAGHGADAPAPAPGETSARPREASAPPEPFMPDAPAAPAAGGKPGDLFGGPLRFLGQARDLFLLAEGGGKLWVIDQHVAHERVLFDRLTSPDAAPELPEPLLIPATLEVDRAHALALDEHALLLEELGFVVEPFGPGRYVLRAVPRSLLGRNYEAVFRDLADELAELSRGGQVKLRKEEVAMAAAGRSCKSAVKAGQRLSVPEIERLLEELRHARNPYTCPHGRPVFLTWEPEEVAALFGGGSCE